jgi:hypothetical protein
MPAPANGGAPSASGATTIGSVISVSSNGTWTNSPSSYSYQWQRSKTGSSWTNIAGATGSSYTTSLAAGDLGNYIRVLVTATNAGGSSSPAASGAVGQMYDPGTTLVNNVDLFGGARLDLSSTQTTGSLATFPSNPYSGLGYQIQVQFYSNYLENENCNGGCQHIYHYLQLVIGGTTIGYVYRGPSMGNGPSNYSGWITTSASGSVVFQTWASAYENDKTLQTFVLYRYVNP